MFRADFQVKKIADTHWNRYLEFIRTIASSPTLETKAFFAESNKIPNIMLFDINTDVSIIVENKDGTGWAGKAVLNMLDETLSSYYDILVCDGSKYASIYSMKSQEVSHGVERQPVTDLKLVKYSTKRPIYKFVPTYEKLFDKAPPDVNIYREIFSTTPLPETVLVQGNDISRRAAIKSLRKSWYHEYKVGQTYMPMDMSILKELL